MQPPRCVLKNTRLILNMCLARKLLGSGQRLPVQLICEPLHLDGTLYILQHFCSRHICTDMCERHTYICIPLLLRLNMFAFTLNKSVLYDDLPMLAGPMLIYTSYVTCFCSTRTTDDMMHQSVFCHPWVRSMHSLHYALHSTNIDIFYAASTTLNVCNVHMQLLICLLDMCSKRERFAASPY
jgi:hypothetical protein